LGAVSFLAAGVSSSSLLDTACPVVAQPTADDTKKAEMRIPERRFIYFTSKG
jgi:hypothetical protein